MNFITEITLMVGNCCVYVSGSQSGNYEDKYECTMDQEL